MNTHAKYNQSAEDYLESLLMLSKEGGAVHRIDVIIVAGAKRERQGGRTGERKTPLQKLNGSSVHIHRPFMMV